MTQGFVRGWDGVKRQEIHPYRKEGNWMATSRMRVQADQETFEKEPPLAVEDQQYEKEISDLHRPWEARGKTLVDTKEQLEKTFANNEKSWHHRISQLQGDVEERDLCTSAGLSGNLTHKIMFKGTLWHLLSSTQVVLKEQQERCARLENQNSKQLAEQKMSHQAELKSKEKIWQEELSHRQGLLAARDQKIFNIKQELATQHTAHMETLALLTTTQAALKRQGEGCATVKDECSMRLDEQKHRHQTEIKNKEQSFQKELCEMIVKAKQELANLQTKWEAQEESWRETKRNHFK